MMENTDNKGKQGKAEIIGFTDRRNLTTSDEGRRYLCVADSGLTLAGDSSDPNKTR